jgi:hypothetical protein
MSDLACCQEVVEGMLVGGRTLAEIEDYIDACPLKEMHKAALWILAVVRQAPSAQVRLANEMLAFADDRGAGGRPRGGWQGS